MSAPTTSRREAIGRGGLAAATLVFVVLGLALAGLMAFYRTQVLEPRLREEAMAQAEILSRSQAGFIQAALRNGSGERRRQDLEGALDELLLLRDPASGRAYFEWVALEIDPDAVEAGQGNLNIVKGDRSSAAVFPTSVALYDPRTSEVLGLARFGVSSGLFQDLSANVGKELLRVTLAGLLLLLVLWALLAGVLSQLERQTQKRFAAERELSRQEKRYERLVTNLSQYFVYRKGANGRLLSVSDSVRRVLGFSPDEFAARNAESLQPSSERSGPSTFEVAVEDAHGSSHRIELSEIEVLGEDGQVVAYDGIARDVTAERKFQEELQHAKDEAEAANQAKSYFLANMSHEIRTPLNAILGMAGLALRSVKEPRERGYLEKIRSSSRLLADIIEDILDLSRIEAGRLELAREPFDLEEMLAEISDVIGVKAGLRGLEVAFRPVSPLPRRLIGDAVRLKQVLLNLLNNAVKFTERGEIVVRIEAAEMRRDRAALRFTVTDTGIGIEASHLQTLFEPFTQVDGSNSRRYGGMGLGLAISRRLVRLMGGEVVVESQVGSGSSFSFTATFALPALALEARRLPEDWKGLHALVVDDNESARLASSSMLEMLSCRVQAVASGEEAIRAFTGPLESGPFRIALVDWKMPGLDGIETALRLKQIAEDAPLAIILVTAFDWEEAARKAEAAGISTVLHKPLSPSSLHDAVVAALSPGERIHQAPAGPPPTRFAPGQTILLVEDQAINREVAREILTQAGLTVKEATNGREALAHLAHRRPDVVLMDVQMPDMDGLAAVARIREDPELSGLPVIAMTAHAMLGDRERFLAAGMSDYVAKPIEEFELFRALSRWLLAEPSDALGSDALTPPFFTAGPPAEGFDLPPLDGVAGLRRAGGNRSLYERLVRVFAAEAPQMVSGIGRAASEGDRDGVRRGLHALKGNAATVSALELAAMAAALETSADLLSALDLMGLEAAVARFKAALPEETAAEAGPAESVAELTKADRARVLSQLHGLADHVAAGNLAARRSLAEVQESCGGAFRDELRRIEAAIFKLDFTEAAREIEALERGLAESGGLP